MALCLPVEAESRRSGAGPGAAASFPFWVKGTVSWLISEPLSLDSKKSLSPSPSVEHTCQGPAPQRTTDLATCSSRGARNGHDLRGPRAGATQSACHAASHALDSTAPAFIHSFIKGFLAPQRASVCVAVGKEADEALPSLYHLSSRGVGTPGHSVACPHPMALGC